MVISMTKLWRPLRSFSRPSAYFSSFSYSVLSQRSLEQSIKAAVEAKSYQQIADLLSASKETCKTFNPFSFLSTFHQDRKTKIIDEVLQSFIPLRPRSRPQVAYSCLLSYTLQSPNPFPLALAILQRTLRSGCLPVPQIQSLLSGVWTDWRKQTDQTVYSMLLQMHSIGYWPDCGTCNYLISSLCKADQYKEAVEVLQGMAGAGCIPDLDSFGSIIGPLCVIRETAYVQKLLKDMVAKFGLNPRQELVVKVLKAMRSNNDTRKAVEMIKFLEEMGIQIGFESYELVVEGCIESGEFALAGKVVMGMTNRGFIPHISVRQKVFEGLASVGELELAYIVRKKFAELNS